LYVGLLFVTHAKYYNTWLSFLKNEDTPMLLPLIGFGCFPGSTDCKPITK